MKTIIATKKTLALGDFIRGCACLHGISQELNIPLKINFTKDFQQVFVVDEKIHYLDDNLDTNYRTNCGGSLVKKIIQKLNSGEDISTLVNKNTKPVVANNDIISIMTNGDHQFHDYPESTADFLKTAFLPKPEISDKANGLLGNVKDNFHAFHIRYGDSKFKLTAVDPNCPDVKEIEKFIRSYRQINSTPLVILCDNYILKKYLTNKFDLLFIDTKPTHSSTLKSTDELVNAATDFSILSKSKTIYLWSPFWWTSSFSGLAARLYKIPLDRIDSYRAASVKKNFSNVKNIDLAIGYKEVTKNPTFRYDIINYYLSKCKKPTNYLEIGLANKVNFNKIVADSKDGVDPNVDCKFKMTSDDFFRQNKSKYDVIFIDGNHGYDQSYKDAENSLKCLSPGGIIIMHDCDPRSKKCQYGTPSGEFSGQVWKTFARMRCEQENLSMFVIDTDYGVGVIMSNGHQKLFSCNEDIYDYDIFSKHRKEVLNLVTVEEWKTKHL